MPPKTHGLSRDSRGVKSRQYGRWCRMKQRCLNPKDAGYKDYGGRGIKVCPEWVESFEQFHADMGYPPSDDYSLDREDNDGDYSPQNCRWATSAEQHANKRKPAHPRQKTVMTAEVPRRVRNLLRRGYSTRAVAAKVGVGKTTVWKERKRV